MRRHPFFLSIWIAVDLLLIVSLALLVLGIAQEYSTRTYLKGFADAIVPLSAPPEQKVEAILAWMRHGPARRTSAGNEWLAVRDPYDTLNYQQLLRVCGSATNAFVNLANVAGLPTRRLLLLTPNEQAKHVLAEAHLNGRWVVVDPAFHVLFRDGQGRFVTRQELAEQHLFQEVTGKIPGYPPEYTFERTAHVRLARIPVVGNLLRKTLDTVAPGWEESVNWTLVLERESSLLTIMALLVLCFGLASRSVLSWYGEKRLGIDRVRVREQVLRAGEVLFRWSR